MPKEQGPAFTRVAIHIRLPLVGVGDTAGAVSLLVSASLGFVFTFEKMLFLPDVAAAGAGATQTFRLRAGGAAGTILDTITLTLANAVLGAAGVASTGVTAANDAIARMKDADTFSITKDAGGTVFSAFGGTLLLIGRERPQGRI